MYKRKPILYLMLIIIVIIFIYNYAINSLLQYGNKNMGMHMGMNTNFYNSYNSYWDFLYFLVLIFLVIVAVLIMEVVFQKDKIYKCNKCGYKIEDTKWHKCPICGNNQEKRK